MLRELWDAYASWPVVGSGGGSAGFGRGPGGRPAPFKLIVTDFLGEESCAFWAANEAFAPFIAAGVVDFAQFDAERGGALHLHVSGARIAVGSLRNPVVGIANYVFDTLRQAVYRTSGGTLQVRGGGGGGGWGVGRGLPCVCLTHATHAHTHSPRLISPLAGGPSHRL